MVCMSNGASRDAGGFVPPGPPPPGYPPPGYYPPPNYQGYAQPGYAPPGYPPPGYAPSGYPPPGYAPPGYQQPWYPQGPPPALKPGVIPLRPLGLSDIFNGAIAYVRMNPKATLGLTTAVVVVAQLIALVMQIGPLAATGGLTALDGGEGDVSDAALIGSSLSSLASVATTGLATIVLSGLLTVVVGRAVFGTHITIGEAWQRARGRLLALIGLVVLEFFGAVILIVVVVGVLVATISAVNDGAAFVIGAPLVVALVVALVYLGVKLSFAPTLIVLERLDIVSAVRRSFALVKNDFWRVFGIVVLAQLVSGMIAAAVSVPFTFGGQLLLVMDSGSMSGAIIGLILMAIGGAIGQIITSPFNAGVVVLLYTDRRMRAEAFDLVLQSGAATPPGTPADSTDHLWLTPHR
jgi:Membrane domain of glycerophosphoryl diester phosphodiesterase